jgi:phosphotransferase system enzyme I (PtsI)
MKPSAEHPAELGIETAEHVFKGQGISPGIAIGPAHVVERGSVDVPEYPIEEAAIETERKRFTDAVTKAKKQIQKLLAKTSALPDAAAEEIGYLLEAHLQMLTNSRLVRGVERRIAEDRINAEAAIQAELSAISQAFAAMDDAYLAGKAQDVSEVSYRLVRNLTEAPYQAFSKLPEGSVILAEEITPADTALMNPKRVGGFASVLGGVEGHTAIMARSLGLAAVLGVPGLVNRVHSGDRVIVDGFAGRVIINPSSETVARYEARQVEQERQRRQLARLCEIPALTRDSITITLQANLELPVEVEMARAGGAEGIGLLRSEFLFMNRETPPSEDEQYGELSRMVEAMAGKPVTVRTLDVGGEKLAYSVGKHIAPSVNPALGLRAIRLSMKVRMLLENQLAAMLRAGAHGPIRILLPLITNAGEIRRVRDVMTRVADRLARKGVAIAEPLPPLGAMIETPGAPLAADSLAKAADFFSIGTNDLTMYTLAVDRGDEQVARLYDPLHPAVLRLIQFTVEAARRADIPVNLCGEMAGDPRYTALLLGLGLRDLSMSAPSLARVKHRILSLNLTEAIKRADAIMEQSDSGVIAVLLDDFNGLA